MKFSDLYFGVTYPKLGPHWLWLRHALKWPLRQKRILVLDNGQDMLDILQDALAYAHYRVRGTRHVADFHKLVLNWRPDLVILDLKLPEGNGAEICRSLKRETETRHIAVILCSAYIVRNEDWSVYDCDAVIPKPFGLEELHQTVGKLLTKPKDGRN